jgi:hypothetical protein
MKKVSIIQVHHAHHAIRIPALQGQEIVHFSLQGLLPIDHTFVLNTNLGTLSHRMSEENHPYLLVEQQFTMSEICVLIPIIEAYPYYCPYEVMYARFANIHASEKDISESRQRLQEALDYGFWDQEMRPIRGVLSRARLKIRAFGMTFAAINETGYLLRKETRFRDDQEAPFTIDKRNQG